MDIEKAQSRYDELYEKLRRKIVLAEEASEQLAQKYTDVQNEMLLRGFNGDFLTERINLAKDQRGRDLLTLWTDADRRLTWTKAEMELAKYDIECMIAFIKCGVF